MIFDKKELSKYLNQQALNKKLVAVSFFITNPKSLRSLHEQWILRDKEHGHIPSRNLSKVKQIDQNLFGGSVALIDPSNLDLGFLTEIKIPLAFGLAVNHMNKSLYVTSGSKILEVKRCKPIKPILNKLFNDLHSIRLSHNNILVTSTGTDSILEIKNIKNMEVCWDWLATENGFNITKSGKIRSIDRNLNFNSIKAITPEHTTHINSSLNYKSNKILATLFHQGQLIEINKKTKKVSVIISGLKSPHNIREIKKGFILCDTRANRVLLLDHRFNVVNILKADFDWTQDTIEIKEEETYLVADSNNYRIVLINKFNKILSSLVYKKNTRKIASLEILTLQEAKSIFC